MCIDVCVWGGHMYISIYIYIHTTIMYIFYFLYIHVYILYIETQPTASSQTMRELP